MASVVIYAFGDVSGAQFNPCVTFGLFITKRLSVRKWLLFTAAQCLGVLCTSLMITWFFNDPQHDVTAVLRCVPREGVSMWRLFFMEFALSFIVLYVICATAFERKDLSTVKVFKTEGITVHTNQGYSKAGFAPLAIGFTLGFLGFVGSDVSAAYNPARVFGTAIVTGAWDAHWIYWLADYLGAAAGAWCQKVFIF